MNTDPLFDFLRVNLHTAISCAFPDFRVFLHSIPLSSRPHGTSGDIASPIAFRLSGRFKLPPRQVARRIMAHFDWNATYIVPDPGLLKTVSSGFINFTISPQYLNSNLLRYHQTYSKPNFSDMRPDLNWAHEALQKTCFLLQRYATTNEYLQAQVFQVDLLKEAVERELLLLLVISGCGNSRSISMTVQFMRKLLRAFNRFYRSIPILTSDQDLTLVRILLVEAVHERLCFLLETLQRTE